MELLRFASLLFFEPRKPKLLRITEDLAPSESFKSLSSSSSLKSALDTGAGSRRVGDGGGLISAVDCDFTSGFSFLPAKRCKIKVSRSVPQCLGPVSKAAIASCRTYNF